MTLDTIMKCAFSQQDSEQTHRSVIVLQLRAFCFHQLGWTYLRGSSGSLDADQHKEQDSVENDHRQIPDQTNRDSATDP